MRPLDQPQNYHAAGASICLMCSCLCPCACQCDEDVREDTTWVKRQEPNFTSKEIGAFLRRLEM